MTAKQSKIYICGKMTGIKDYNYPKFNQTAKKLRDMGYIVSNPAEVTGDTDWVWSDYMKNAIGKMVTCDILYVLEGYETSTGASIEIELARNLNMTVIYENGTNKTECMMVTPNNCSNCIYDIKANNNQGICII